MAKRKQSTQDAQTTDTRKNKPKKTAARRKKAATPKKRSAATGQKRPQTGDPATPPETGQELVPIDEAQGFPIVGIGASAGGLEALDGFFDAMPPDSGMAFVLVVHLAPTHVSILPELLQKRTKMPVHTIAEGMQVEPNHVYVIPSNKDLTILNGQLHLMDLSQPRGVNLPIDAFLRALALDQRHRAIAIILSGTGTDGTLGVKAIKGELGMVMVQDETSAGYTGMPRSAVATGLVDYVLPPGRMPEQLIAYSRYASRAPHRIAATEGPVPNALQKILIVLRAKTGHDFSLYKKNTICRRIERRMSVHQIDNIDDYARYLQGSDREAGILFKELLIGVTNFFRDRAAFQTLQDEFLPNYLSSKPLDYTVRVWVPGCATGEEAYSLAMILYECMEKMNRSFHVQIFGTDIDEEAVNVARAGLYPASILPDVGEERLKRHFAREEDGQYRVSKTIREMLVFAPQNVIKDPPFTKLDLLSCRNLLIYLGPELQKKLLPLFFYSLRPQGILFLGSSETVGQSSDKFALLHKKWKIYQRKTASSAAQPILDMPLVPITPAFAPEQGSLQKVKKGEEASALHLVETLLQQSDMPPCVMINDNSDIVYVHGRTGQFLEPAEGKASFSILQMARPGLKAALATAIRHAATHKQEVVRRGLTLPKNGGQIHFDLVVRPITEQRGTMLVMFQETESPANAEKSTRQGTLTRRSPRDVEELEQELQYTKEHLQTTIEELETSNEELKSTNEELHSTNEELQSANEELETSKEELQSLNEEAATVNAELQARIDDLAKANDDLKNLLDSTEIATIFLDTDLRIRRFTPQATRIIPLASTDIGRPLDDLSCTLVNVEISSHAKQVVRDLAVQEVDVKNSGGEHFIMRIRPYRTMNNVIDGAVLTFENITRLRQAEKFQRLAVVVRDSNDAVTLLNRDGRIIAWNRGAEKMYGYSEEEAVTMNIKGLIPPGDRATFDELMQRVFDGASVRSETCQRMARDGRRISVSMTATRVGGKKGEPDYMATTEREIQPDD